MTNDEATVQKAFCDLVVHQRDAAWVESANLRAEMELMRSLLRLTHDDLLRAKKEGRDTERAVVAWLRKEMQQCSGPVRGTLAWAANSIEEGKHRCKSDEGEAP